MQNLIETKTLTNPNFWYCYLISSFGQIGEPFESEFVRNIFNVNEKSALDWWNSFTGYYEGIFDETDGQVENPNTISIEFQNHINLVIEFHAGDTYYYLQNSLTKESANLGTIGGHWIVPMLRWNELVSLSQKLKSDSPIKNYSNFVMLLILPCIWLTKDEDFEEVKKVLVTAWSNTGLINQQNSELITLKFSEILDARQDEFYWFLDSEGNWVTNAEWSSRFSENLSQNSKLVAEFLNLAMNN